MKRLLALFVSLLLLLCGCTMAQPIPFPLESRPENTPLRPSPAPTLPGDPIPSGVIVDARYLELDPEKELPEVLEQLQADVSVILPAALSEFGSCTSLRILGPQYDSNGNLLPASFDQYFYVFIDQGFKLLLTVTHVTPLPSMEQAAVLHASQIDQTDLRNVCVDTNAKYVLGDIIYNFLPSGELSSIQWDVGDIHFVLKGELENLSFYPYTDHSFVSRLLNANTAPDAISALKDRLLHQ